MATPFPNERPIDTHDVIDMTENGVFSSFEDALQGTSTGANQSKKDYDFRQAANGNIVLAKPKKSGNLWAIDLNNDDWVEGAQYDPKTGGIDDSQSPQNQPVPTNGPSGTLTCPGCGQTGVSGKFCNSCGASLANAVPTLTPCGSCGFPLPHAGAACPACVAASAAQSGPAPVPTAGQLAPGQTPSAGAGAQSAPRHINPNRMEGKPKKEVVVPAGMTSVVKSTGFSDALDKLFADAETAEVETSE